MCVKREIIEHKNASGIQIKVSEVNEWVGGSYIHQIFIKITFVADKWFGFWLGKGNGKVIHCGLNLINVVLD